MRPSSNLCSYRNNTIADPPKVPVQVLKVDESIMISQVKSPHRNQNNDKDDNFSPQSSLKLSARKNSAFEVPNATPAEGTDKNSKPQVSMSPTMVHQKEKLGSVLDHWNEAEKNLSAVETLLMIKKNSLLSSTKKRSGSIGCSSLLKDALKVTSHIGGDNLKSVIPNTNIQQDKSLKIKLCKEDPEQSENKSEDKEEEVVLRHPRHGELSQRRDVIFKTIFRDMRKYYRQNFNETTGYVSRKRYKRKDFYLVCVDEYIQSQHIKPLSMKNSKNIKDFNIYLGALIYPKELEAILQKTPQKKIAKEIYDALYKFSLGKMKSILIKDGIHNLFMHYYEKEILNGDRLKETPEASMASNNTMTKHRKLYLEAFKVMSQVNRRKKSLF
ncbi:unnamed protein product [Moneuplotes crassus]|uniref:Uncharacterized protein n=1 Tax=Euplotes crassus TaxID=5936 RepID=A0AAD1UEE7_EUPCR|nr:unnamed protein product [Moneuplotes crassus]